MEKQKEIFIHIGYPKTATTTLQECLFSNHSELTCLRKNGLDSKSIKDIFYSREGHVKRNLNIYEKNLKEIISKDSSKYIYSEESLTSFSMYYRFEPNPYIWTIEPNSIARKLNIYFKETNVFDSVKVIVTIRKQDEMIKSMYSQVYNLVFKKFKETRTFAKFLQYSIKDHSDNFISDTLHYNDVIKEYETLFGKENLCVLVFEELEKDKNSYIRKLCQFCRIDFEQALDLVGDNQVNKKSSRRNYKSDARNMIEIMYFYKNKYLGNVHLGLTGSRLYDFFKSIYIPGKVLNDISIDEYYEKKLESIYSSGNKKLSERHNLSLKEYGYYYE